MTQRRRADGEGSIYQRTEDGMWVGVLDLGWHSGKRVRKSVYDKRQEGVVRKLAKLRAAADTGLPLPGEQQTLGDYLESWLTDTLPGSVRPSTEASYGDLVRRHIAPALGRVKLDRLTPAQVRSFLRSKQGGGQRARQAAVAPHGAVHPRGAAASPRAGPPGRAGGAQRGHARQGAQGPARRGRALHTGASAPPPRDGAGRSPPGALRARPRGGTAPRGAARPAMALRRPWTSQRSGCGSPCNASGPSWP